MRDVRLLGLLYFPRISAVGLTPQSFDLSDLYIQVYTRLSALQLGMLESAAETCASADSTSSSRRRFSITPTLDRVDSRRDYGERRVIALGQAQDIALTVVYADRAEGGGEINRRIISARKSSRREREAYKKATNPK